MEVMDDGGGAVYQSVVGKIYPEMRWGDTEGREGVV